MNSISFVLIVAKCIVNWIFTFKRLFRYYVLIVAKCIVNYDSNTMIYSLNEVLIVAKCIVNLLTIDVKVFLPMY